MPHAFALQTTLALIIAFLLTAGNVACGAAHVGETRMVDFAPASVPAPAQLRATYRRPEMIPFPPSNPYTPAKSLLGRTLFNDTRLSDTGSIACASCHNPGFSYGDGLAKSLGHGMKPLGRRAPSIINSAWGQLFLWDGSAASLEQQVFEPIEAPAIMNLRRDQLIRILTATGGYAPLFASAFPGQPVTPELVANALATYERTIVSAVAPFDAWIDGDEGAIPLAAKRGFELFNTSARCALCHGGWRLTDDAFHDIGLPDGDRGRGALLPGVVSMQHAFKTPSLRETAQRAPYMHDGSLRTLAAVIAHYNQAGIDRPSRSALIRPLGLSADEQNDIVAFLQTLSSQLKPGILAALPQ